MSTPKPSSVPNRPLSPFMIGPYYKPQLTSMLSITHRATGMGLSAGTLLLAGWLIALASGPAAYAAYAAHLKRHDVGSDHHHPDDDTPRRGHVIGAAPLDPAPREVAP